MAKFASAIEGLLLVAGRPLTFAALAKILKCTPEEVEEAVGELEECHNKPERGIHLMVNNRSAQLTTNPDHKNMIADFMRDETTGELTKASLETLTIIAYRQPISREELEHIRGVNCSIIVRNLSIRGLIEAHEERGGLTATYTVTNDFLRFLGVNRVEELPDYERLHSNESLKAALEQSTELEAMS